MVDVGDALGVVAVGVLVLGCALGSGFVLRSRLLKDTFYEERSLLCLDRKGERALLALVLYAFFTLVVFYLGVVPIIGGIAGAMAPQWRVILALLVIGALRLGSIAFGNRGIATLDIWVPLAVGAVLLSFASNTVPLNKALSDLAGGPGPKFVLGLGIIVMPALVEWWGKLARGC